MTPKEVIALRLLKHQILETSFTKPEEIVSYYGAMQAQDWSMAKWALGLRLPHLKEINIEDKFNDGKILRTHLLRPTWHFVTPENIRWILMLTSPRVHQSNKLHYKKFGLDAKLFSKAEKIIEKTLRGNNYLTREELTHHLEKNKVKGDRITLTYIMMHAELESLICSGPRKGKQFTYALIEERVPVVKPISKAVALEKLTFIYFNSRGPATVKDYAWWSGLTLTEARSGVEMLSGELMKEKVEGEEYFYKPHAIPNLKGAQTTFLIPDYDEYVISYKDRSFYHHPKWKESEAISNANYFHAVAVDGYFGGTWSKKSIANKPQVEVQPFKSLSRLQLSMVDRAIKKYQSFFS